MLLRFFLLLLVTSQVMHLKAQSGVIYPKSVLNAASYAAPGLPHGSIARGSVFSIFGLGLGPSSSPGLAFPLSTTLGGVSVKVFQASTSVNAIPLYVGGGQVNAIMPSNAPLGRASVQVVFNGFSSNPAPITIVNSSFGIYAATGAGLGPGVFQNFNSQTDQPVNAPAVSAKPGQVITLWGTGLGPVPYADNIAPSPVSLTTPTEVFVGGQPASLLYNGRSPCCSGSDQIVFTIPSAAPLGCWVPVFVRTEGKFVSNSATISISADGSPCSEPANPFASSILKGGKVGDIDLKRSAIHDDYLMSSPVDFTSDLSAISFQELAGGTFAFSPSLSLPPAGACTTYSAAGDLRGYAVSLLPAATTRFLNAGATFTVAGPTDSRVITLLKPPQPDIAQLGKNLPGSGLLNNLFLNPGSSYTVTSTEGTDVGAIQATAANDPPLTWSNETQISTVNRTQPLVISWAGAPSGRPVEIEGVSFDSHTNSSASFFCIAPAGSNSFTVPNYILQNLPASPTSPAGAYLGVGALPTPAIFTATGLDTGVVSIQNLLGKNVIYQ